MKTHHLLWLLVLLATILVAYHTHTHTRLREVDLEMVQLQNEVIGKSLKKIKNETDYLVLHGEELTYEQGNSPKDVVNLNKARRIKAYADSLIGEYRPMTLGESNLKVGLSNQKLAFWNTQDTIYSNFIVAQDTSLSQFKDRLLYETLQDEAYYAPFLLQQELGILHHLHAINYKSIDRLIACIGGVVIRCYFGSPVMKVPIYQTITNGNIYEGRMFMTDYTKRFNIIEFKLNTDEKKWTLETKGNLALITIPTTKQHKDSVVKSLTGKIKYLKPDGTDTTFQVKANYVVRKRKQ